MKDRQSCDNYCPAESSVQCGVPEYADVELGLRANPQRVWACHSNSAIPCVATELDSFPKDCTRYTESENFLRSLGLWEE